MWKAFSDCKISCNLWPPYSPDLTTFDFCLWDSIRNTVHKTNLHSLEEVRKNIHVTFQLFPEKNFRELTTTWPAGTLHAFGQDRNIFSMCCSTGKFLLHFLKVILTVIAYCWAKTTFTVCYHCTDAATCGLTGHPLNCSPLGQTGCGTPCTVT